MDDSGSGAAAGGVIAVFVIAYIAFLLIFAVGVYVLYALSFARLFRKAGVEPWIGWVPYYNVWKILELGAQPGWMVLIALVPGASVVLLVFLGFAYHRIGISFGKDTSWVVLGIFLPWLWAILLGRDREVYDPRRLAAFGYPPPSTGYGAFPAPAPAPAAPGAATQPPPTGAPRV